MLHVLMNFGGGRDGHNKKETDDTCNIRGRSRLGGLAQELLPDSQPLVSA